MKKINISEETVLGIKVITIIMVIVGIICLGIKCEMKKTDMIESKRIEYATAHDKVYVCVYIGEEMKKTRGYIEKDDYENWKNGNNDGAVMLETPDSDKIYRYEYSDIKSIIVYKKEIA